MEKYDFNFLLEKLQNMPNGEERNVFLEISKKKFSTLSEQEKQEQRDLATAKKNELIKQTKDFFNLVNV